ncbi:MarR family transcriptional regulator [soil metagenome]|jgi:DNA-binding MarR family transcriptional regulator
MKIEEEIKQSTFKDIFNKLYINIVYTSGWLQVRQAKKFKEYGVSLPQYNILRILRGQHPKPASVNLLIDRMLDKTSNASRIVDKLEIKKLVTRTPCLQDRRTVEIRITEKGLDLLDAMADAVEARNTGISNLTEEEAEQLSDLLDKIRS